MDQKSTNFVNVTLEKNYKCLGIFYHFSLLWTGSNKKISISSTGPALQKSHNHFFLSCSYIMSRNSFPPGVDKIGNKTFLDPVSKCYESPFSFFSFSFFFFIKERHLKEIIASLFSVPIFSHSFKYKIKIKLK